MRLIRNILFILFFTQFACKKPYDVPAININYAYLVVEGNIELGLNKVSVIHLTRTQTLKDTSISTPETLASVQIESNNGTMYPLIETADGEYVSNALQLNSIQEYRLKVITSNSDQYASAFVKGKQAPEIDSITWKQDLDINFYVHSHDPNNATGYYKWEFDETAQHNAPIESRLGVKDGLIFYRDSSTQVYNCWATTRSNTIAVASTKALSADVVSYQQIHKIFKNDPRLDIKYSINVRQYAISEEAFRYWQILQKSTQQTGSIFDPQPAQINGNITCVNHPEKTVIGFISAGTYSEKRIFISNSELINWVFDPPGEECTVRFTNGQDPNNYLIYSYPDTSYAPQYFVTGGGIAVYKISCLDCTRAGGTSKKPAFWK
jgi:Domain of unknown function (DUF4249)